MLTEILETLYDVEFQIIALNKLFLSMLIIIAAIVLQKLGKRAIGRGFTRAGRTAGEAAAKKLDTTGSIIAGVYKYIVLITAVILILQTFNVDLSSVLTLAGVGGIAVGIGAQSLVRDILNGIFIWFENQFAIGDKITVADKSGTVVEFNLRTTKIVDEEGELYIIPNSEIRIVKNSMKKGKT